MTSTRTLTLALLLLGIGGAEASGPAQNAAALMRVDGPLQKASVGGKYGRLLRRLYLPNDRQSYTAFRDWGRWEGTDYGGFTNLPPGYWVYVYPHWLIWRDCRTGAK